MEKRKGRSHEGVKPALGSFRWSSRMCCQRGTILAPSFTLGLPLTRGLLASQPGG